LQQQEEEGGVVHVREEVEVWELQELPPHVPPQQLEGQEEEEEQRVAAAGAPAEGARKHRAVMAALGLSKHKGKVSNIEEMQLITWDERVISAFSRLLLEHSHVPSCP
jgi:hypothetical protein